MTYQAVGTSDPVVEILSFQYKVVVTGRYYTTLDGNGASCVYVVTCHHAYSDARILAANDRGGYLQYQPMDSIAE